MVQLFSKEESQDWIKVTSSLSPKFASSAVERDIKSELPDVEIQRLKDTGLLSLVVPLEYGGVGASWVEALKIVQEISQADGSIGQLYGNHLNLTALAHISGTSQQKERYYRETAEKNLFWANAINTRDTRLKITPDGEHYLVNGVTRVDRGVAIADFRVFAALQDGVEIPLVFVIPQDRDGVFVNKNWEIFSQERADNDTFIFHNVVIKKDEILGYAYPPNRAVMTFLEIIAQLTTAYVYLGIAEGALAAANEYNQSFTRPQNTFGIDKNDSYLIHSYGQLWTELQAAIALADQTAIQLQKAWEKDIDLNIEARGKIAIAVFATKAFVTQVSLNITNNIFEVLGNNSAANKYNFDKYWRDLRHFILHDPVDYKPRDIGNWLLNQEYPIITKYS
ncbi:acyl-CoA dehydrogenase family protein [Sphaerospermopsis aphanizomenoides BCCUSP55]|uniref:acyl-CoA dehydrogenase family protein n=1 Tax=Sphaerospermopsis aphanizomenoides TaxID=459663 RepID=UPI0019067B24|nr:acyl-CoA dehydrogenase family protein [Sphaerospermopsis aphanizomenoides]MBK1989251.1 acyl-CoA dehydrogenase family protein [Sphaerospermopsis aphanizomenoides BCCUSP55]